MNRQDEHPTIEQLQREIQRLQEVEQTLHQRERQLQALINNIPGIVFRARIVNGDKWEVDMLSDDFRRFTGYSTTTFSGPKARAYTEIVHPEDRQAVTVATREAVRKGETYTIEYRICHRNGRTRWVAEKGTVSEYPNSGRWLEGVITDISDQKHAESINRTLYTISNAVSTTANLDELYQSIHRALSPIIDVRNFFIAIYYRDEHRISFPFFVDEVDQSFHHLDVFTETNSLTGEVIRTRKPILLKQRDIQRRADRQQIQGVPPLVWLGVPLMIEREVVGVMAVQSYTDPDLFTRNDVHLLHSVSEQVALAIHRKQTVAALEDSEQRYRSTFETIPDPIAISRRSDGRYLYVNDGFCATLGFRREEVIGRTPRDLGIFENREDRDRLHSAVGNDGKVSGYEIRFRRKDGMSLEFLCSTRPLRIGEEDCLVFIGKDITAGRRMEEEKAHLEEQLWHAQKMEAVGTLSGGISHDFNNLLMGIQGNVSLMLMTTPPEHPNYRKLKNIEDYVASGAELTRQLLGFARGGKYEVRPSDINAVLTRAVTVFGRAKKEIRIHQDLVAEPWTVQVDQGQIEQVFLNLFVNAWQAMPSGGDLSLSTENVELDRVQTEPFGLPSGKFVQVSVADTGTGMDENTRQRVFDPFFTTKEMGRGTGLGLASVYGIIKNHGGFITVRSAPKQGTVFRFFLPATSRSASGDGLLVSESMPTGTETILLVDDEAMILDVSEQLLAHLGYTVITADSGTMAIERFEAYRERIALVILDMIMPDMMGGEVFERIRQLSPNTQVILSSGYSEDGQASEILKRGCSGFLQKPYDLLALSQKVRAVLDRPFPSDT